MKPAIALLACASLCACAGINAEPKVYVVSNNPGGTLQDAARWDHEAAGRVVMIDGPCASRCVAWAYDLGRREPERICISHNATFQLHQGYRMIGGKPVFGQALYAKPLDDFAASKGGLPASLSETRDMTFAEAKAFWRVCGRVDW